MLDLLVTQCQPARRPRRQSTSRSATGASPKLRPASQARPGKRSMRPASWCRRRSSTRISTWTRRCRYGLPRINQSGTLLEGIALWGELKPQLTFEAIVERALTYCDWAVAKGLLAIRSHVDVCDPRLLAVEALLEVKKRVAPYLDLQLVAFPQDGVLRSPGALRQPRARARPGCRGGRRHSALRAHHGRRRGKREAALRAGRAARAARGHALRRDRRPDVAAHRDAGLPHSAARPAGPGQRLAPHVHALDGQLLRVQADSADGRGAGAARWPIR